MAGRVRFCDVLLAVLLAAPIASAEEPSAADKAVAESLFQDARALLKKGALENACPKFAESFRLAPRLGTLLNLATCHEKQGKTASAWAEFKEAAALARRDKRRDREKYAADHASALEKKLSRVVFELDRPAQGATLSLDGDSLGKAVWGTSVPVDPGPHELEASAPGRKTWSSSIVVEPGPATVTVRVPELEPAETDAAPAAAAEAGESKAPLQSGDRGTSGSTQRTLGWLSLGVGVVGVGVGSWFGLQTFSKQNESDDHCDDTRCDQTGVDLRDEAKSTATLSTIGFAVGAVGVGAGLVLLLTAGGDEAREARTIWIAPGLGSLTVGGRL